MKSMEDIIQEIKDMGGIIQIGEQVLQKKRLPFLKFEIRVDSEGIEASAEESEIYTDFDEKYKFTKEIKDLIEEIEDGLSELTDLIVEHVNKVDKEREGEGSEI